ncbi:unnamed protein product [marine sediment metagenome]|uniref:Uncharacterized protein n=1 Tax=marine sediment metagenome TaxID=412755 RepID=X1SWD1_9ZZZZ
MLRYKRITTPTLTDGKETIIELLSCPTGKKYRIVSISTAPYADMYLRVYRQAEQIVDAASIIMTTAAPLLPMDLPLNVGQVVKAGFYNDGAVSTDPKQITIGYRDD